MRTLLARSTSSCVNNKTNGGGGYATRCTEALHICRRAYKSWRPRISVVVSRDLPASSCAHPTATVLHNALRRILTAVSPRPLPLPPESISISTWQHSVDISAWATAVRPERDKRLRRKRHCLRTFLRHTAAIRQIKVLSSYDCRLLVAIRNGRIRSFDGLEVKRQPELRAVFSSVRFTISRSLTFDSLPKMVFLVKSSCRPSPVVASADEHSRGVTISFLDSRVEGVFFCGTTRSSLSKFCFIVL